MTSSLRDVSVQIGKASYSIGTSLDDDSLKRMEALMADVTDKLDRSLDQEKVLLILCLQLAWTLENTRSKIEGLYEEIEKE